MIKIRLFTTLGCHLCEDAERLLTPLTNDKIIVLESVDIADDDDLVELYGIRIPVIKRMDSGQELGWPFDYKSLSSFLV